MSTTPPRTHTELLLGPIIGGLTHEGAHLWGRADGTGHLYAWLGRQPDLADAHLAGVSQPLSADGAYTGVAPLRGLEASQRYHYALTLDDRPPDPVQGPYPAFTTFPSRGEAQSFNFAFGSCFCPEDVNGGGIFQSIRERAQIDNLRFILMIGDQIYADAHDRNGLGKIATTLDEYRALYAYSWSRPPLRELLANLPAFMIQDDHEVDDDWTWTDRARTQARIPIWDRAIRWLQGRPREERQISRQRVRDAEQAYWEHQGMHAPHFLAAPQLTSQSQYVLDPEDAGSLAYTFDFGAASFFVMDTRTARVKSRQERIMLGEAQWRALEAWLLDVKDDFPVKFLVTSSALLFEMWIDFARDRWNGFSQERDRLLHFLAAHGIEGVYLLTGDLHSAHAVRVDLYGPGGQALPVWEFCSSPFEQRPNRWARHTYWPLRSGPIRDQQLVFVQGQHNFGVVRVEFSEQGLPRVRFRAYGDRGQLLAAAGS